MLDLRISITGGDKFHARLEGMSGRVRDLTPAFELIRQSFWNIEEEQFDSEGGFSGGWKALSNAYDRWKQSHYPGRKILELTGALRRSLTGKAKGTIAEIAPMEARFGTRIASKKGYQYGRGHQKGEGNLPERKAIELTEDHKRQWIRIIQTHIMGGDTGGAFPGLFNRGLF